MSKGCARPQVLAGCWLPGAGAGPGVRLWCVLQVGMQQGAFSGMAKDFE